MRSKFSRGRRIPAGLLVVLLTASGVFAQWSPQGGDIPISFRTVSAINGAVAWLAGDGGSFARTINGGGFWEHGVVAGAQSLDFRDLQAFDVSTAYLMSYGGGAKSRIYKTVDAGRTWKLQFLNSNPRVVYVGFAFWDSMNGIAVSDSIDGRFIIIKTNDGGESWWEIPSANAPRALPGETALASGTAIAVYGETHVWIGTGGSVARVLRSADRGLTWQVSNTPISSGGASSGIASISFKDSLHGVIVGGDAARPKHQSANFARSSDGGRTWELAGRLPGYRSAAAFVGRSGTVLLAVGPSGSDYSSNHGITWHSVSAVGFRALSFPSDAPIGWAVGEKGTIGKWAQRD